MIFLKAIETIVFDCDGVILDSNKVKTRAFYNSVLLYGPEHAESLVKYHVSHGGISRYEKFKYFFSVILGREPDQKELSEVLYRYAEQVREGLMECDVAPGLFELRDAFGDSRWLIVSGGDQEELREIFSARGLYGLFDGGIFGSPDSKDIILSREIACNNIIKPALFIGDSKYDYESAIGADLDFVFANYWTEFFGYESFFQEKPVSIINGLSQLIEMDGIKGES